MHHPEGAVTGVSNKNRYVPISSPSIGHYGPQVFSVSEGPPWCLRLEPPGNLVASKAMILISSGYFHYYILYYNTSNTRVRNAIIRHYCRLHDKANKFDTIFSIFHTLPPQIIA